MPSPTSSPGASDCTNMLLDRKLSQAATRRVDLLVLLDIADHTRLTRLTLTRDDQRWLVVVEALDRGENLVMDLHSDQRRWSAAKVERRSWAEIKAESSRPTTSSREHPKSQMKASLAYTTSSASLVTSMLGATSKPTSET